jgi:hypothetical protein
MYRGIRHKGEFEQGVNALRYLILKYLQFFKDLPPRWNGIRILLWPIDFKRLQHLHFPPFPNVQWCKSSFGILFLGGLNFKNPIEPVYL